MNERLKRLIETYLIQAGANGIPKLSIASGCSQRLIYRIKNEGHVPRSSQIYQLALACGLREGEALALAREETQPAAAREPA